MICPSCQKEITDNSRFCYLCGAQLIAQAAHLAAPDGGPRRFYRSASDRRLGGVCSGMARYFDTDVSLVRIVTALLIFFSGIVPGLFLYLLAWLVVPIEPEYGGVPPAAPARHLQRSMTDRKIGGVCGGLAQHFGADSSIVRVVAAVLIFCSGVVPGLFVYLVLWIAIPLEAEYQTAVPVGNPSR
jgi:phage shock protein PspC (stress-responsive transcriptional regulator)